MVRITCINKDNGDHYDPHEAIYRFGWTNESTGNAGFFSLLEMVRFVEGGHKAFVRDRNGHGAYLEVRISRGGNKYVRTIPNSLMSDNLLTLPECRR